ncbi:MAG: hypothetical protein ACTS73_04050 [Arsenophonus sp. NEOnobi-MAG3]
MLPHKANKSIKLLARKFIGQIKNTCWVSSYSGLTYHDMNSLSDKFTVSDINIEIAIQPFAPKIDADA